MSPSSLCICRSRRSRVASKASSVTGSAVILDDERAADARRDSRALVKLYHIEQITRMLAIQRGARDVPCPHDEVGFHHDFDAVTAEQQFGLSLTGF